MQIIVNVMLPSFFWQYSVLAFIIISLIEGLILNFWLKAKWNNRKGILLGFLMNFISSILGLVIMINYPEMSDDFIDAFATACLLSILIEYTVVSLWFDRGLVNRKLIIYLTLGNVITYILIGITAPLMEAF